jgi:hypothetical protein
MNLKNILLFLVLAVLGAVSINAIVSNDVREVTVQQVDTSNSSESVSLPKSNAEIRQWYNDQVSNIPRLNLQWVEEGLTAQERAKKAYLIRHQARIDARSMMQNQEEVTALQKRDMEKYGNPDGPNFEYLVEKNRTAGLVGDEIYEAIVDSSKRTNRQYNEKLGVKTEN